MALPFFYIETIDANSSGIILNEETSKHVAQVLRMQMGEQLQLTDGKGNLFTAEITDNNKKHCTVTVLQTFPIPHSPLTVTIAISLIKNTARFEWFLEKATEIGVSEIIPLICERTEKEKFRYDRMQQICVSAMLQSQQSWLPVLHEPIAFDKLCQSLSTIALPKSETLSKLGDYQQKFIAHCMGDEKRDLADMVNEGLSSKIILIGPEGDFTQEEVDHAVQCHFIPVALGNTRLRTETAGVVAAALLV